MIFGSTRPKNHNLALVASYLCNISRCQRSRRRIAGDNRTLKYWKMATARRKGTKRPSRAVRSGEGPHEPRPVGLGPPQDNAQGPEYILLMNGRIILSIKNRGTFDFLFCESPPFLYPRPKTGFVRNAAAPRAQPHRPSRAPKNRQRPERGRSAGAESSASQWPLARNHQRRKSTKNKFFCPDPRASPCSPYPK